MRARIAGRGRRVAALQHHAHHVAAVRKIHRTIAGQRAECPGPAFALLSMALRAVLGIDLGAEQGIVGLGHGRGRRLGRGQRLQIRGHGLQVVARHMLGAAKHHFGHGSAGRGRSRDPGLQQAHQVLARPQRAAQRRRIPILQRHHAAAHQTFLDRGPPAVARRMAGGAMPQPLHQVGAAVPFGRRIDRGLPRFGAEIQCTPDSQRRLGVERKRERMRLGRRMHRRQALQIGEQRVGILAHDARVLGIGKGRVQQTAVL